LLEELFRDAVIPWLIGSLHKRSFGLVMLLIALVGLVPGVRVFIDILLGFPALQMILGQESPSLPRFIALAPHLHAEDRPLNPLREYRDSLEELAHLLQRCAR
jgi:hypothetical protein